MRALKAVLEHLPWLVAAAILGVTVWLVPAAKLIAGLLAWPLVLRLTGFPRFTPSTTN